jgi:hypothetical protein
MAESLGMSLGWVVHMREGNDMHEKRYGLGKGRDSTRVQRKGFSEIVFLLI